MSYEKAIFAYAIGLVVFVIIAIFAILNLADAFGDVNNFVESSNYNRIILTMNLLVF